jgi:hypothetical protein
LALAELAHIEVRQGAAHQREAGSRNASVKANLLGRDQGSFVAEAQVARLVHLPPGYRSLGRPVRKPAARREAPGSDRADHRADDLFAAVLGLPLVRRPC